MFVCLFVCLFVYIFNCFCFNHRRIPTGNFPPNFVKIRLDLAEILRISKLDWRDRGGKKEEGRRRRGGILLCNGLICGLWSPKRPLQKVMKSIVVYHKTNLDFKKSLSVCLFVCLLTCLFFILIILEHPQECTLQIS